MNDEEYETQIRANDIYIMDKMQEEIEQLTNNWNELEEWLESNWKDTQDIWYVKIINKMKEIKESNNV